jgi:hypothetical protein
MRSRQSGMTRRDRLRWEQAKCTRTTRAAQVLQYEGKKGPTADAAATPYPAKRTELQCMPCQLSWPAKQARHPSQSTRRTAVLAALAADTPTDSLTSSTASLAARLLRGRCAERPCVHYQQARRQDPRRRAAGPGRAGVASQKSACSSCRHPAWAPAVRAPWPRSRCRARRGRCVAAAAAARCPGAAPAPRASTSAQTTAAGCAQRSTLLEPRCVIDFMQQQNDSHKSDTKIAPGPRSQICCTMSVMQRPTAPVPLCDGCPTRRGARVPPGQGVRSAPQPAQAACALHACAHGWGGAGGARAGRAWRQTRPGSCGARRGCRASRARAASHTSRLWCSWRPPGAGA